MSTPLQAASGPCPNCASTQTKRLVSRQVFGQTWFMAQCSQCRQHYTDPLPKLEDLPRFYSSDFHEDLRSVEATNKVFGPKTRKYVEWLSKYMQPGRSLDLGCSTGLMPHLLQQQGFAAEGLELNPESAEFARSAFGLEIRNEPFETADYPADAFDLVSLCDVLEHSLDPYVTLTRVNTLLKAGGFAFITFPDIESLESRYFQLLSRVTGRNWLWWNCNVPRHTWEFTRSTAEALFERGGFKVVAFRRTYLDDFDTRSPLLTLLYLPPKLLALPFLAKRFGTQMEFILKKEE